MGPSRRMHFLACFSDGGVSAEVQICTVCEENIMFV